MSNYKNNNNKNHCIKLNTNLASCKCTYNNCDKKGLCCQCISYHRKMKEIPGCLFTPEGERTYDRSYNNFYKNHC